MAYTLKELKAKTAAELKEIAAGIEHEAVKGYTQMNKEHLVKMICTALGIHMHEHVEVKGLDRAALKVKIRALKKERDQALAAEGHPKLRAIRHSIKEYKKKLRKAVA
jgi:DNA-binding IclR family transcriptional regulator